MIQGERPFRRLVVQRGLSRVRLAGHAGLASPAVMTAPGGRESQLQGEGDTVLVGGRGGWPWQKTGATILLDTRYTWELEASGGFSQVVGALEDVHLSALTVSGGLANVELALGRPAGACIFRLSGGAHHLVIRRPEDVGVRLTLHGGVAHLALDDSLFGAVGGKVRLESRGCATAPYRYDLELSGGASHLQIR